MVILYIASGIGSIVITFLFVVVCKVRWYHNEDDDEEDGIEDGGHFGKSMKLVQA